MKGGCATIVLLLVLSFLAVPAVLIGCANGVIEEAGWLITKIPHNAATYCYVWISVALTSLRVTMKFW